MKEQEVTDLIQSLKHKLSVHNPKGRISPWRAAQKTGLSLKDVTTVLNSMADSGRVKKMYSVTHPDTRLTVVQPTEDKSSLLGKKIEMESDSDGKDFVVEESDIQICYEFTK